MPANSTDQSVIKATGVSGVLPRLQTDIPPDARQHKKQERDEYSTPLGVVD
jgi:hypothetical protein